MPSSTVAKQAEAELPTDTDAINAEGEMVGAGVASGSNLCVVNKTRSTFYLEWLENSLEGVVDGPLPRGATVCGGGRSWLSATDVEVKISMPTAAVPVPGVRAGANEPYVEMIYFYPSGWFVHDSYRHKEKCLIYNAYPGNSRYTDDGFFHYTMISTNSPKGLNNWELVIEGTTQHRGDCI